MLVTGAGGFLGSAVVRSALRSGMTVVAAARSTAPPRLLDMGNDLVRVTFDLYDMAAVERLLDRERPDVIVHTAWSGLDSAARASSTQLEANVVPSCNLLRAAALAGVRKFVGIGSQAEYGTSNHRITEADLPQPISAYGAAKIATFFLGAELSRQVGMDFAWLRLFATYGPGDNPNWLIPSVISQIQVGMRPKSTLGTQKWDYLYIDDAANGIVAAAISDAARGALNLSSDKPVAVRTIVERLRDLIRPDMELVFGEVPFSPSQIMHMQGSNKKLIQTTGWSPQVGLQEGLARTVSATNATAASRN